MPFSQEHGFSTLALDLAAYAMLLRLQAKHAQGFKLSEKRVLSLKHGGTAVNGEVRNKNVLVQSSELSQTRQYGKMEVCVWP